tara:strand:- start:101 stop:328 length:228 start_codon:yes stop_codon:yes gene_type:complete
MSIIDSLIDVIDESDLYHTIQVSDPDRDVAPEYFPLCKECGLKELDHQPDCVVWLLIEYIRSMEEYLERIELIGT